MAGPSILVVDDEQFIRRIVRQTLSNIGIAQVTEADSAVNAETLLSKNKYDVILCDIYMPKMSGLELLKKIRSGKSSAPNDSRVIFLTSFSNTEVLKTSMELDVNGFLVKPIKSNVVKKKILRAISEQMFLKDEEAYESIEIDMQWTSRLKDYKVIAVGGLKHEKKAAEPKPDQLAEEADDSLSEGVILASILQLDPGATLAEDLVAKDGTLLLSSGQKITQQMINRMHDLHSILRSDFIKIEAPEDEDEGETERAL